MADKRTDAEVICEFMEPKIEWLHDSARSAEGWWVRSVSNVIGCRYIGPKRPAINVWTERVKLGAMHEVEARLVALGFRHKIDNALSMEVWRDQVEASTWHASAEQKIRALGPICREELKRREAERIRALAQY